MGSDRYAVGLDRYAGVKALCWDQSVMLWGQNVMLGVRPLCQAVMRFRDYVLRDHIVQLTGMRNRSIPMITDQRTKRYGHFTSS